MSIFALLAPIQGYCRKSGYASTRGVAGKSLFREKPKKVAKMRSHICFEIAHSHLSGYRGVLTSCQHFCRRLFGYSSRSCFSGPIMRPTKTFPVGRLDGRSALQCLLPYGAIYYFSFVVIRSLGYKVVDGSTNILFGGESVGV